jgi:hypothetical protein
MPDSTTPTSALLLTTTAATSRSQPTSGEAERIANLVVVTTTVAVLATLVAFGCVPFAQLAEWLLRAALQRTLAYVFQSMPKHIGQLIQDAVRPPARNDDAVQRRSSSVPRFHETARPKRGTVSTST